MSFWSDANQWITTHQVLVASVLIPVLTVVVSIFASWASARSSSQAVKAQFKLQTAARIDARIEKLENAAAKCVAEMNRLDTVLNGVHLEVTEAGMNEAKSMHKSLPLLIAELQLAYPGNSSDQRDLAKLMAEVMKGLGTVNPANVPDDILIFVQKRILQDQSYADELLSSRASTP